MANLSLTSFCNRRCGYCFAGLGSAAPLLRREDFRAALDLLEASGVREARLLGGEPTLHPEFPALVAEALERGFRIQVFSNGLMPEAALECLESLPPERCGVLLNLPPEGEQPPAERDRVRRAAGRLGARACPGVNIHRRGMDLEFLLEWIASLGLAPAVRLGLAHPRLGEGNDHLHPKHYAAVGRQLTGFARRAVARAVRLDLDCGFVPCMFPPEFFEITGLQAEEIGRRCAPIPDLLPGLEAAPCFALAPLHRIPVPEAGRAGAIRDRFAAAQGPLRSARIYRECDSCPWLARDACHGGCLAAALTRARGGSCLTP